jgi:hypothetical protein
MKTLFLILISFSAFAQNLVIVEEYVPVKRMQSNVMTRDTIAPGTNYFAKYILVEQLGLRDTTKQLVLEITPRIIDVVPSTNPEPVIETIDNIQMIAANGWTRNGTATTPGWHNNTTAWSATAGATLSYTFTGTKVDLYAERKNTHGKGQIIIMDGNTEVSSVEVDYSLPPHGLQVLIWASPTLPRKQYTLITRVNSGTVVADYVRITK